jgi:hypothetical protein
MESSSLRKILRPYAMRRVRRRAFRLRQIVRSGATDETILRSIGVDEADAVHLFARNACTIAGNRCWMRPRAMLQNNIRATLNTLLCKTFKRRQKWCAGSFLQAAKA